MILLVDDNGMPIPQHYNSTTGVYEPSKGNDGAMYIKNIDTTDNGSTKVVLYTAAGEPVQISKNSIPVVLSDPSINLMVWNGYQWVNGGVGKSVACIASGAYTADQTSQVIYNNGAQNCFILVDVAATPNISKVEIHVKVGQAYVKYKEISTSLTAGANIITCGINDATNKFAIPAEFKIVTKHANSTSTTYTVDVQLS